MLKPEQENWVNHLSDTDLVAVVPFDPTCETKFRQVRALVQDMLGHDQAVEHRGASSLGISGQDEIDVYVPVPADDFDETIKRMTALFGEPRSRYHLKRARFVTAIEGKHVDVFVINRTDSGWTDSEKFHAFVSSHPEALEDYRKLKETAAGQSVREYYRRKIEFINEILDEEHGAPVAP